MIEVDGAEPIDRLLQAFLERDLRFPLQVFASECYVRATACRVIWWKRSLFNREFCAGEFYDQFGQFANRELTWITDVDWADEVGFVVHQSEDPFDQIVSIAEGSGLFAFAEDSNRLTGDCLADEVRYYAAVVGMHAWSVGVEYADDTNVDFVHAVIVHEQCFGDSFAFVIARSDADGVDIAPI